MFHQLHGQVFGVNPAAPAKKTRARPDRSWELMEPITTSGLEFSLPTLSKKLGNAHGLNVLSSIWTRTDLHRVSVLPVFVNQLDTFHRSLGLKCANPLIFLVLRTAI